MTTYLYWIIVIAAIAAALWIVGGLLKHWGGVMHVSVPDGQRHLGVTWKDDHLWIESFDPASNTCEFREYSRDNTSPGGSCRGHRMR